MTRGLDASETAPRVPGGYRNADYARSLCEVGEAVRLAASGASVVLRDVPGSDLRDAVGPYPLFACADWARLGDDVAALSGAVSVVFVTDPLSRAPEHALRTAFPDLARPYKLHYVADLTRPEADRLSEHHRRKLRRLQPGLEVERIEPAESAADEWTQMYGHLVRRHEIRGVARFSRESFGRQLRVPGCAAYRAALGGETLGMALWFRDGGDAWYHLGASTPRGYEFGSAFAIFRRALADLAADGALRADLGGAAGLADDPSDGLARFKRGWSTETTTSWLCGRVLDRPAYDRLVRERGDGGGGYFPAYRARDVLPPTGSEGARA